MLCVSVLSKCVHSLIELSLPSGGSEVGALVLQEAWDYYEEALSIIGAAVSQHQSQAGAPELPPPASSSTASPSCIINPLACTHRLPAVLEASLPFSSPFFYQWAFSRTSMSRCFHSPPPSCQFEF